MINRSGSNLMSEHIKNSLEDELSYLAIFISKLTRGVKMSKRKTTEQFIIDAKLVHGEKYNYSKVDYINNQRKIIIICPEHGEFLQIPNDHLNGRGCRKCLNRSSEDIIKQAKIVHGNKYDYSKLKYKGVRTKVIIICPVHGEFLQTPEAHLYGHGCSKCVYDKNRMELSEFIKLSKEKHGDKFDYSKVLYTNSNTKVIIICPEHGEFEQTPSLHLQYGCSKCGIITTDAFIKRSKEKHGDRYDYSKSEYIKSSSKVTITCQIHGDFLQNPQSHMSGTGCPLCFGTTKLTNEDFIKLAKEIHGEKYNYSKVEYVNIDTKIIIICPEHGEFLQSPYLHKNGSGCPKCAESRQTSKMATDWLKSLNIQHIIPEYRIPERLLRSVDGYDPLTNTIYQFHGDYFHGNPKIYKNDGYNKLLGKTFGELYERTCRLDQELMNYGYNLVIMWESDYTNVTINKKSKKKII